MPFLIFRRDHLRSNNLEIISGLGIKCDRGSFAALYISTDTSLDCLKCSLFFYKKLKWNHDRKMFSFSATESPSCFAHVKL